MAPTDADLKAVFCEAADFPAGPERDAYLDRVCPAESPLRDRVALLLQAHDAAGRFLGSSPVPAEVPDSATAPTAAASSAVALGGPEETATHPDATPDHNPSRHTPAEGPGSRIGPYTLLRLIGEGGMGVVYQAEQTAPVRRTVALKVIKPGMDTKQVIARFEAERQALAMMDHPNIARVFDAGTTGTKDEGERMKHEKEEVRQSDSSLIPHSSSFGIGRPYFVMEQVRGIPITEYCDREGLSIPERLELFVLVCRAVQHAHQKGIIHRDLKPSNILVTVIDGVAVPKVIDFGVAKATGVSLTERTMHTGLHQFVGTPLYMSPEQADLSGVDVDTRSDIYSLGVLLYELLTGTTPFDAETFRTAAFDEMRRIIREEEPPRPSTRLSALGETLTTVSANRKADPRHLSWSMRGELDWIVMRALEKDRRHRYETANDFASDVMRYLTDQPVEACPPSAWYRLSTFVRRNRVFLTVGAVVLAALTVLCGSVGWSLWEWSRRQARVEADIMLFLRDADLLQQQRKWTEAMEAAKRAQGLLGAGRASNALNRAVNQRVSDLTLAAQVDAISTDRLVRLADRDWSTLADPMIDARYSRAFQDGGINVRVLSIEEAAARIRPLEIRMELAAALDHWTTVRHDTSGKADPFWKKLQALATAVDPDPFRVKLRQSWADFNVPDAKRIFDSPEVLDQPIAVLMSLAMPLLIFEPERWLDLLGKLYLRHPDDFWINYSLGEDNPSPVDALRFCTAAVAIRPTSDGARLALGAALAKLGRFDDAIVSYKEAIRLKKDFPGAHNDLGNALRDTGRIDEAIAEYREAIRLDKEYALAHLNLGSALGTRGQLDDAIACFKEVIRLTPGEHGLGKSLGVAHDNLGTALAMQGKLEEATASWRAAIRVEPKNVHALNSLAWFLATSADPVLRNPKQAVKHAEQATTLAPNDAGNWNTLGVAQYRNGNSAAAIEALTKSIKLGKGGNGTDFFFTAMAHWQLGHKDQAAELYKKAVQWVEKNQPNDEELLRLRAEAAALLGLGTSQGSP
jgi:serine/threonine protein kinase/Flp pilus assembly protein TadD